jgi:predicted nucleic acid-binding protein
LILDARVLIAHLDGGDPHHERAVNLLLDAAEESYRASPITLAEVLTGPARIGALDRAKTALAAIGVRSTGMDDESPEKLAAIRAATGLKMPDCCVVLAAEQDGTDLATFDDRLASVAKTRGIRVRP